jgi:hypothetical protein
MWSRNCLSFRSTWVDLRFLGVHVARSFVFYVVFCRSLFLYLFFFPLAIVMSVLQFTASYYRLLVSSNLFFYLTVNWLPVVDNVITWQNVHYAIWCLLGYICSCFLHTLERLVRGYKLSRLCTLPRKSRRFIAREQKLVYSNELNSLLFVTRKLP